MGEKFETYKVLIFFFNLVQLKISCHATILCRKKTLCQAQLIQSNFNSVNFTDIAMVSMILNGRRLFIEENHQWKMTSDRRQPWMKEDL